MKKCILLLFIALFLLSCKKFVDITHSIRLISNDAVFSNDQTALAAVGGLYTEMRIGNPFMFNGGVTIFAGLSADEIYPPFSNEVYDVFYKNAILSNNATISDSFWIHCYQIIYRTNLILEGLQTSKAVSGPIKKQLSGEMKMVRSLAYFYLLNLYGDVPLVLTTSYQQNAVMPRTSVSIVYRQIINDLLEAQASLTVDYPSTGKFRPNKFTATAMLARVYLYQQDWGNAELQSAMMINSGQYHLITDNLNRVFLTDSEETIWEIASSNDAQNTAEGMAFVPQNSGDIPSLALNKSLLEAFEPGDNRMACWVGTSKTGSGIYCYPYKYKSNLGYAPVTENNILLRLAEQYLIRAEARAQLDNTDGAVNDLNTLRTRAGLDPIPGTLSKDACLIKVAHERQVELFAEWGHRWLDLKRTGKIDQVMKKEKSWWKADQALFPIPHAQILYNTKLVQNNGYTD